MILRASRSAKIALAVLFASLTTGLASAAWAKDEFAATAPTTAKGFVLSELGAIALGKEFPQIAEAADYQMRARYVTLEPGGIVPLHSHKGRPAITYIIEGEAIEHRSDADGPIVRASGDVSVDNGGISQWWENEGEETVTMFVVDFLDPAAAGEH